MRRIEKYVILFSVLILLAMPVSAFKFNVSQDVKDRANMLTLPRGAAVEYHNMTIAYYDAQAIYTSIFVDNNGEEIYYSGDGGGVANQFVPDWTNNLVFHIEKMGAEGSPDLNYVSDYSEITVWVEDNAEFIASCGDYIEDPKNIGTNTGNWYSNEDEYMRRGFLGSYQSGGEEFFYSFELNPAEDVYRIKIYEISEGDGFRDPVDTVDFAQCGDTTFNYEGKEYLIQPYFYMENGNYDIAVREITRICPADQPGGRIISVGLYDDLREPIPDLFIKDAERFGSGSVKLDIQRTAFSTWSSYIFSDCEWKSIDDDLSIKLAGLYGREAEFYVYSETEELFPPAERFRPFWDRVLGILGVY
jgi:hypothetical protein